MKSDTYTYPRITGFRDLQTISFTTYYGMKDCIIKGLPHRCIAFTPKAPIFHKNRQQLLGILYHRMLEEVKETRLLPINERADKLRQTLQRQCLAIEESNINNPYLKNINFLELPEIGILFRNVSNIIFGLTNKNQNQLETNIEISLTSSDKQLTGILDVLQKQDSAWYITEHKSGRIYENNTIKSKFYLQAHFYAQLVYEAYGSYPKNVTISGLDGTSQIEPDLNISTDIAHDARRIIKVYNKGRASEKIQSLANSSANNCGDCNYQAFCENYWSSFFSINISTPRAIRFKLLETINLKSNRINLRVSLLNTQIKNQYILSDYYPNKYQDLELIPNREYIATKVILNSQTNTGNLTNNNSMYRLTHE